MKRAHRLLFFLFSLCLAGGLAWSQDSPKPAQEQLLFVAEQLTYTPPYAIGDISVADPTIADYRVMNGRREVLLFGKAEGRTTLKIWDQKHARVTDILVRVTTREAVKIERDLRDLLKDYPSVRIAPLGGSLVIAGEVSSERDLEAIQSIADAANVRSVVKYVPPTPVRGVPTPVPTPPGEKPAPPGDQEKPAAPTSGPEPVGNSRYSSVEYEIQILEASVAFSSGTYGEGVQPSGPVLVTRKAQGAFASPIQVEIMDPILVAKLKRDKGPGPKGLRLRLTPSVPDEDGAFVTRLEIETNLPYESKAYDPALWRRARWQIPSVSGEPLGIAGSDLLAVMSEERSAGSIWNTLQNAAGMAGNFGAPNTGYATMYYYDPAKKTQLLMLIKPRLVPRTAG